MEIGTKIYCISESVYPQHLTKGKEYVIQDLKPEQFRIKTNQEKLAWFPSHCFSFDEVPEIVSIHVDDEIREPKNGGVEVTIQFSNGEKRWTTFVTTTHLNGLLESENYLVFPKCIIVQELKEPEMKAAIVSLDKQNELIEVTQAL